MKNKRVIPILLLSQEDLVKSVNFKIEKYLGDPLNAVRIFNDKDVDELCIIDVSASIFGKVNFRFVERLVSQAFYPIAYGGGVRKVEDAKKLIHTGVEKVIINGLFNDNLDEVKRIVSHLGASSVVLSLDFFKSRQNNYVLRFNHGSVFYHINDFNDLINKVIESGVGELIITDISRDGTKEGYNLELLETILSRVNIPVTINGGLWDDSHVLSAFSLGASGCAGSGRFVFYGPLDGVLINYPNFNLN